MWLRICAIVHESPESWISSLMSPISRPSVSSVASQELIRSAGSSKATRELSALHGADEQEQRHAYPPALGSGDLANRLDREPGIGDRGEVVLERVVAARECHRQTVPLDVVDVAARFEVRLVDHEGGAVILAGEVARRVDRVHDGRAEHTAGSEHPRRLGERRPHIVEVMDRHVGDDQVERGIDQGHAGCVRNQHRNRRLRVARCTSQARRSVQRDDPMTRRAKVAGDPALAAPEVERQPPGRRQHREERGASEAPVGVVTGLPRPADPLGGMLIPGGPQVGWVVRAHEAFWSRRWDPNPRPATYEAAALPAELRRRVVSGLKPRAQTVPSAGMGTLTVERLAQGDYALIKPLLVDLQVAEQAHYKDHPQLARWEIEDQLDTVPAAFRGENVIFAVRDNDGSVIGFCWIVLFDPGTGLEGEVAEVSVAAEHRGKGVGEVLMQQAVRLFRERGVTLGYV